MNSYSPCIEAKHVRNSGYAKDLRKIYEKHHNISIQKGLCVCHKCDNKSCINVDHLFLGTYSENELDKIRKGRHMGKNGKRLTMQDVLDIRAHVNKKGKYRGLWTGLSKKYGVLPTTIQAAAEGRNWKWL